MGRAFGDHRDTCRFNGHFDVFDGTTRRFQITQLGQAALGLKHLRTRLHRIFFMAPHRQAHGFTFARRKVAIRLSAA